MTQFDSQNDIHYIYVFNHLFYLLFFIFYLQVICYLDKLKKELQDNVADNCKLDCLRKIESPHLPVPGDELEKIKKLQRDGDCSFESTGIGNKDWNNILVKN